MSSIDTSPCFTPLHLIKTPAKLVFMIKVTFTQSKDLRDRLKKFAKKRKSDTPLYNGLKRKRRVPPAPSVRKLTTPSLAKAMTKPPQLIIKIS